MSGYNDDLVMSFAICLWVRDTALRLKQEGIDLQKKTFSGMASQMLPQNTHPEKDNQWEWKPNGKEAESLAWLIEK